MKYIKQFEIYVNAEEFDQEYIKRDEEKLYIIVTKLFKEIGDTLYINNLYLLI